MRFTVRRDCGYRHSYRNEKESEPADKSCELALFFVSMLFDAGGDGLFPDTLSLRGQSYMRICTI